MRIVIQKVLSATVTVEQRVVGEIGPGLLVLLGVTHSDTKKEADFLVEKTCGLRIFPDSEGKMNRSIEEAGGEILVVSQFTLYGDCSKGKRPSFITAARPEHAKPLYEYFASQIANRLGKVETGEFGASMEVSFVNEGPVTLVIDSPA